MTSADAFLETLAASGLPPLIGGRHAGGDFHGSVVTRDLGPLRLTELVSPEGECFRDERSVRAADSELWQIDLVTRGRVRAEQGGNTAELGPADFVLIDPVRPVRFASTASTHVTMLVPRRSLPLGADVASRLAGVRVPGDRGAGALVSVLARGMARSTTGFRADEADRSAAAVIELIAVALSAQLGDSRPASDEALRARIVGFVEARLSDRDITPAKVAAAHHMSLRRLHKLFEDQPLTVAALIRRRRLERCRADLAGTDRTVAAVAARWGFADPAHFSRLFKATYGYNAAALTSSNRARMIKALPARPGENGG
jgi:AraC-like DNA-binding protein